ncbi:MAG TPA: hypothetical protein PK199_01840 [Bacteroidales bacterium]|nr:hypothetical protein [Bacteroidales bacterium]
MKLNIYIIFCVLLWSACSEYELQDTIMVYDSEHKFLPEYSEWGYNSFGAYYDREIFVSNKSITPAKLIFTNDSLTFMLNGIKGKPDTELYYDYYNSFPTMSIAFQLSGYSPESFQDLTILHNTTIDLIDTNNAVYITIDTIRYKAQILSGSFSCKRAQLLYVDTKLNEVILSGEFDFKALVRGIPMTISYGRYDVGVNEGNFYLYDVP